MTLLYASLFLAGVLTVLMAVTVIRQRKRLSLKAAMVVAMGAAMIFGLLVGTVLGIGWKQITWPTILAVCWGMAVGLLSGLPVGMIPALEGLFAGLMSGAMGPMLGVMAERSLILVYFLDGLTIILTVILLFFIRHQKQK